MDGFEVRMHFIEILRKMNALVNDSCSGLLDANEEFINRSSQQSIQKVVGFAAKHFHSCGEDIWNCIVEHTENVRFHITLSCGSLRVFFCFL